MERSSDSFDLESLVTVTHETSLKMENLVPLHVHPGHDIIEAATHQHPPSVINLGIYCGVA